jgi:cytochrome c oxidase subunit 2
MGKLFYFLLALPWRIIRWALYSKFTVLALFVLVPILGVYTFVKAPEWKLWFPENVSSYGDSIDNLFHMITWMVGITFVLTELVLVWVIFRFTKNDGTRAEYTHGNHVLEMVWTAIPSVLLLVVAFSQMGVWSRVKINFPQDDSAPYTKDRPLMEVWGSQFDWRVRYPDEEGNFEGADVIESAFDIYVPVDVDVVLHLRSRDVLHSFFVPRFRVKQDAVPGMTIPVWFNAEETGDYDLICAELCGWGHYKMAGKVHVLEQDEFDQWLTDQREALFSNGAED